MTPALEAHLRLLATLPVRTHHAPEPAQRGGLRTHNNQRGNKSRPAAKPGTGRGGHNARPMRIAGTIYGSKKEACEKLRIGHNRVYQMIDTGEATYV